MPKTHDVRRNQIEKAKEDNTLYSVWAFSDGWDNSPEGYTHVYWEDRSTNTPQSRCVTCGVESYFVEYEDDDGNTYSKEEVEEEE